MTKLICALALLVALAYAAPQEGAFLQDTEVDDAVEAVDDEAAPADDSLRTLSAQVQKLVTITKSHVPAVAVHAHAAHAHAAHAHPAHAHAAHAHPAHAHAAHAHAHAAPLTTPAPVAVVVPDEAYVPAVDAVPAVVVAEEPYAPVTPAPAAGYVAPPAPLAVVPYDYPVAIDKDKVAALLKKLLSGAIDKVQAHPIVAAPSGKPVAIIFSAAMHVVDLGTLQTLVSAKGAAVHPSYEPAAVKVEVAKPADAYVVPAPKPKVVVAVPAKKYAAVKVEVTKPADTYEAPAPKPKVVVVAPAAKYAAPAAKYAAAKVKKVVAAHKPAYVAAAVTVAPPAYSAPAKPAAVVKAAPKYKAPVEAEVAVVEANDYVPATLPVVKKYKKPVVAKDVY